MEEPQIRVATTADIPAVAEIVDQAYRHYIARIGKPPGPMLDDYAARISEGSVWVLEEGGLIVAIIVLVRAPNYFLLDNIAVSPASQGLGWAPAARIRGGRGYSAQLSRNPTLHP
jgi:N-acetylglutamate synthase-like GNAT family acetyltransferase